MGLQLTRSCAREGTRVHAGRRSGAGGSEALDNRCRFLCFVQNNLDDQLIKMCKILESLEKRNKALYYTGFNTGFMHFWRRLQFCESFSEIVIHKCDRTSGCGSVRKCI
jgi:hypothetical protein